jgi:hypothetical protein
MILIGEEAHKIRVVRVLLKPQLACETLRHLHKSKNDAHHSYTDHNKAQRSAFKIIELKRAEEDGQGGK